MIVATEYSTLFLSTSRASTSKHRLLTKSQKEAQYFKLLVPIKLLLLGHLSNQLLGQRSYFFNDQNATCLPSSKLFKVSLLVSLSFVKIITIILHDLWSTPKSLRDARNTDDHTNLARYKTISHWKRNSW